MWMIKEMYVNFTKWRDNLKYDNASILEISMQVKISLKVMMHHIDKACMQNHEVNEKLQ